MTEPGPSAPEPSCWKCGRAVALPPRLEITVGTGRVRRLRSIRLTADSLLYAHHLEPEIERHDFTKVIGAVTGHPKQPGVLGLTNRGTTDWTVHRDDDGDVQKVPPGRTAALRPGLLIEFGGGGEAVFRAV